MTDPGLFLPSPDGKDYQKLFEKYQEKFNKAYLRSLALWKAEKIQRQALYTYKRKVNALLDLCGDLEDDHPPTSNDLHPERIANLIELNPKLASTLLNVLSLDHDDSPVSQIHHRNLYMNEIVPEVIGDELDHVEINPQEPESWVRRQYPHLVVSKFKPLVALPALMVDADAVAKTEVNQAKRKRTRADDDERLQKPNTTSPSIKKLRMKLIITGPKPTEHKIETVISGDIGPSTTIPTSDDRTSLQSVEAPSATVEE